MKNEEFGSYLKDEIKDTDSIDRCWEEKYRNDSRKWLIRDSSFKLPPSTLSSTMRESYMNPQSEIVSSSLIGKRRAILLQKFYDEAAAEIIREQNDPPPTEEYCSEYDGNYYIPGFETKKESTEKDMEMFVKYPLYSSNAATFYSHHLLNKTADITGVTNRTDPNVSFKKHTRFSKPIEETLENVEL